MRNPWKLTWTMLSSIRMLCQNTVALIEIQKYEREKKGNEEEKGKKY